MIVERNLSIFLSVLMNRIPVQPVTAQTWVGYYQLAVLLAKEKEVKPSVLPLHHVVAVPPETVIIAVTS